MPALLQPITPPAAPPHLGYAKGHEYLFTQAIAESDFPSGCEPCLVLLDAAGEVIFEYPADVTKQESRADEEPERGQNKGQPEPIYTLSANAPASDTATYPYEFVWRFINKQDNAALAEGKVVQIWGGDPATDINTIKRGA